MNNNTTKACFNSTCLLQRTSGILYPSIIILLATMVLSVTPGCTTANPFSRMKPDYAALPVEDLSAIAQSIEKAVSSGDRNATIPNQGNVTVDTPQLKQAIRTRAARYDLVRDMLESGYIIEEKGGLISIQRSRTYTQNTSRQERDRHAMVVMSENRDRWTLYEDILKVNNFAPRNLSAVQTLFHQARIMYLPPNANYEEIDVTLLP